MLVSSVALASCHSAGAVKLLWLLTNCTFITLPFTLSVSSVLTVLCETALTGACVTIINPRLAHFGLTVRNWSCLGVPLSDSILASTVLRMPQIILTMIFCLLYIGMLRDSAVILMMCLPNYWFVQIMILFILSLYLF